MKLKHKDLLCIHDLSTEEVLLILDVAKNSGRGEKAEENAEDGRSS